MRGRSSASDRVDARDTYLVNYLRRVVAALKSNTHELNTCTDIRRIMFCVQSGQRVLSITFHGSWKMLHFLGFSIGSGRATGART